MSLTSAMQIARSGLTAAQLGIQLAGNNIANVGTPGYSRQVATLTPQRGSGPDGVRTGAGVLVRDIQRQVDGALQARLWNAGSDQAAAAARQGILSQIESALGELNDNDLSSELSAFFQVWSERANQTRSSAAVVQQGATLAEFIRRLRSNLTDQRSQSDAQLSAAVQRADLLAGQIARLNRAVSDAEVGGATANVLRDQRDQLVTDLASLLDATVIDRGSQGVDVLVGSTPIVLGADSRGISFRRETVNGQLRVSVIASNDGSELSVSSGMIGGLLDSRSASLDDTLSRLDSLASALIYEVNRIHATGANATGLRTASSMLRFPAPDRALALNDPANATMAALPFAPVNGGFTVSVRHAGGPPTTYRINVDLDGLTASGTPGFADDTSLDDLRAALDAIPGLSASLDAEGRLSVSAAAGFEFNFADDSSGVLGALGVNAYFTGRTASDIGVRPDLLSDSSLLAAGRLVNGALVENGAALAIAGLQTQGLASLNGTSIADQWRDTAATVGTRAAAATSALAAAGVVRESLQSQRDSISAVSIDEESINLLSFQRQYQGSAKVISVADEMTQTLLQLI